MIFRRTGSVTASRCIPSDTIPAPFMRSNQTSSSGGSHCAWMGRSTRAGMAAAASATTRALRALDELRGRLAGVRPPGRERLADRAELAGGVAVDVADALLEDRGREHVGRVELRDLPVGNPLGGGLAVEAGRGRERDVADALAVPFEDAAALARRPDRVGRRRGRGRVDG